MQSLDDSYLAAVLYYTMPEKRETFIPYTAKDVIQMCLRDGRLNQSDERSFESLSQLLSSIFHFEFHRELEALKDAYCPFDPDSDTQPLDPLSEEDKASAQSRLLTGLTNILEKANYQQIGRHELEQALSESSMFKIRLDVEFEDFQEVVFFARGEHGKEEVINKLLGLKKETVEFDLYDRVVVYVRFKEQTYFDEHKRKNLNFTPGSTVLKLFSSVPKADLEILFPNVKVKMRGIDKILIGIPAAIGGIAMLMTKLLSVIALIVAVILFWLGMGKEPVIDAKALIAAGAGMGAAAGYILKQVGKFKNRKIGFLKALTDQLYFKNLDNNAGVIFNLITSAEEEEVKEAVLAYYFLLTNGSSLSEVDLDQMIEQWFQTNRNCSLDFDIKDAIHKLQRLGLAQNESNLWTVIPLNEATRKLDEIWDGYYKF